MTRWINDHRSFFAGIITPLNALLLYILYNKSLTCVSKLFKKHIGETKSAINLLFIFYVAFRGSLLLNSL